MLVVYANEKEESVSALIHCLPNEKVMDAHHIRRIRDALLQKIQQPLSTTLQDEEFVVYAALPVANNMKLAKNAGNYLMCVTCQYQVLDACKVKGKLPSFVFMF